MVVNIIKYTGLWEELETIMQKYVSLYEEMWLRIVFKCLFILLLTFIKSHRDLAFKGL